jgi:hypothetical protein
MSDRIIGTRFVGELKEHDTFDEMGYDVRLTHNGDCARKGYVLFQRIHEVDREVREFEVDADNLPDCDVCGKGILVPSYDEVQEWWDNSEYGFSTYPPSAWHEYMEREGIGMTQLLANPAKIQDGVEEMQEAGDGRKCECEWAEHEKGCDDPAAELGHSR